MLFDSEWASWHGEDIFVAKYPAKKSLLGGFLSYDSGKGMINLLLNHDAEPTILAAINFGYEHDVANFKIDTTARKLNAKEAELFKFRFAALKQMNTDTTFKNFNNASLNPVPIIINGEKRVYVLTGPNINGVVLFGNDYLIKFEKNNAVKSVQKLHKGLIPIYTKSADGSVSLASVHNHLPEYSPFITAIDICTLMLYEKMTTWNQHIVVSKDYASIWDCKTNKLSIMTYDAWQKANPAASALGGSKN